MAVVPAFDELCRKAHTAAYVATHSDTPPVLGYFYKFPSGLGRDALIFNQAILNFIKSEKITSVILVASWEKYFQDESFSPALLKTVDELRANDVSVYFLKRVPNFGFDVPRILTIYSLWGKDAASLALTHAEHEAKSQLQNSVMPELRARGVHVLEPAPFFQSKANQDLIMPGDSLGPFFRDNAHLSSHGARMLIPLFASIVDAPNKAVIDP